MLERKRSRRVKPFRSEQKAGVPGWRSEEQTTRDRQKGRLVLASVELGDTGA